jgi:hypothetical protein
VVGLAQAARACSCANFRPAEFSGVPHYDAVFRGTVREIVVPWALADGPEQTQRLRWAYARWTDATVIAVVDVHEWWRGSLATVVEIDVGNGRCCNCSFGAGFPGPGSELLVFAGEYEDRLSVGTCSAPLAIEQAEQALAVFGPGYAPVDPEPEARDWMVRLVGAAASLGLLVLALLVYKRGESRQTVRASLNRDLWTRRGRRGSRAGARRRGPTR